MIKFSNVSKIYGGNNKAVDSLDLEIREGEIFGFLGPNGAGKSTTIKMLTGIVPPTSGKIEINGFDISSDPLKAKKEIGYVPDNPDMFLRLKGVEYLNFMADMYEVPQEIRASKIENLSKSFEMENALDDKILSYSHGMRQKIVLMGALIHDPNAWVLDEPMTGLDPKSSYLLKEMMRQHADSGKTVFFSTHVLEVAEKICDRVGIINRGKLIFTGGVADLRKTLGEDSSLENMFLELTNDEK